MLKQSKQKQTKITVSSLHKFVPSVDIITHRDTTPQR